MTEPAAQQEDAADRDDAVAAGTAAFEDLDRRPVSEHVSVFETEHARLRDELSTIDEL